MKAQSRCNIAFRGILVFIQDNEESALKIDRQIHDLMSVGRLCTSCLYTTVCPPIREDNTQV